MLKGNKKHKQKNRAQNKLGFRDTLTESSSSYQYLYTMRRGEKKTEKLPLEDEEGEGTKFV